MNLEVSGSIPIPGVLYSTSCSSALPKSHARRIAYSEDLCRHLSKLDLFWRKAHVALKWKLRVLDAVIHSKVLYGMETLVISHLRICWTGRGKISNREIRSGSSKARGFPFGIFKQMASARPSWSSYEYIHIYVYY